MLVKYPGTKGGKTRNEEHPRFLTTFSFLTVARLQPGRCCRGGTHRRRAACRYQALLAPPGARGGAPLKRNRDLQSGTPQEEGVGPPSVLLRNLRKLF